MILYVISSSFTGLKKIGVTRDINQRVTQLMNAFKHLGVDGGLKLEYYVLIPEAYKLEKILHKYYRKYRAEGEWFTQVDDVEQTIERFIGQV